MLHIPKALDDGITLFSIPKPVHLIFQLERKKWQQMNKKIEEILSFFPTKSSVKAYLRLFLSIYAIRDESNCAASIESILNLHNENCIINCIFLVHLGDPIDGFDAKKKKKKRKKKKKNLQRNAENEQHDITS